MGSIMVINNFLPKDILKKLLSYVKAAEFSDVKNDADGVVYPLICRDIPEDVSRAVYDGISNAFGVGPVNPAIFMRMSPKGVPVTNIAHTDNSMGNYSLMLYLNNDEDAQGGTALLTHNETGATHITSNQELLAKAQRDANDVDAWSVRELFEMKQNRAVIFDAHLFHRAEPLGGFGNTKENSRVVLTVFFS